MKHKFEYMGRAKYFVLSCAGILGLGVLLFHGCSPSPSSHTQLVVAELHKLGMYLEIKEVNVEYSGIVDNFRKYEGDALVIVDRSELPFSEASGKTELHIVSSHEFVDPHWVNQASHHLRSRFGRTKSGTQGTVTFRKSAQEYVEFAKRNLDSEIPQNLLFDVSLIWPRIDRKNFEVELLQARLYADLGRYHEALTFLLESQPDIEPGTKDAETFNELLTRITRGLGEHPDLPDPIAP